MERLDLTIHIKPLGRFHEVQIIDSTSTPPTIINLGLLDDQECLELAATFEEAAKALRGEK
jgi:hypothetical protein